MDCYKKEKYIVLIEKEKDRIKNQILESYIALRKQQGITQHEAELMDM